MSHKETLVKQREMGKHHGKKVKSWKANVNTQKHPVDETAARQGAETLQTTLELAKDCNHY